MKLSRKENVSQKVNIYFHLETKLKDESKLCPHNFKLGAHNIGIN